MGGPVVRDARVALGLARSGDAGPGDAVRATCQSIASSTVKACSTASNASLCDSPSSLRAPARSCFDSGATRHGATTSGFDSNDICADAGVNGNANCKPVAGGCSEIGEGPGYSFGGLQGGRAGMLLLELQPPLMQGSAPNGTSDLGSCRCRAAVADSSEDLCLAISLGRSLKPAERPWLEATPAAEGSRWPATALLANLLPPDTDGNKPLEEAFRVGAPGGGMDVATGMPAAAHLFFRVALAGRRSLDGASVAFGNSMQLFNTASEAEGNGTPIGPNVGEDLLSEPKDFECLRPAANACGTTFKAELGEASLSEPKDLEGFRPIEPTLDT